MSSIFKRGTTYYLLYDDNGRRRWKSLRTGNRAQALAALKRYQAAIQERGEQTSLTVADLRARYETWAPLHRAATTVYLRTVALDRLADLCPDVADVADVTGEVVERFKRACLSDHGERWSALGARSINEMISGLRAIWSVGIKQGWIPGPNPWTGTERLKEPKRLPRWLTRDEIDRAMDAAELYGRNQHLTWALGVYAGLRHGEIVQVRWSWVDLETGVLTVRGSAKWRPKDRDERTVALAGKLADVLRKYRPPETRPDDWVIAPESAEGKDRYRYNIRRGFDSVSQAAGLGHISIHTLRHTFASRLAQEGVSLYKISRWMGHSLTRTTELYGHLRPDDDDIDRI